MKYEIKAFKITTTYEKCWIEVEANSEEEALKLVKENPWNYDVTDSKVIDLNEEKWVDKEEWEITDNTK